MRVIGTAGHVDHGKSTLIQALTGIDPDRLREEKERGMTIDLGFAWLRLPSGLEASIVDVPGHERFIKNMLAGVGGIDTALLVIAADEGVMPQTREHLAILDLLGIDSGVIAITKRDLVDDDWLDLVMAEVEEVVAPTSLRAARLIPVSSPTGEGLPELCAELDRLLAAERQRRQTGSPRLPVDRVFTMPGFGTVVTGTLVDGELHVGQEVEIVPTGRRARIRGLQSHRKQVDRAPAGTRVAVNLSGVPTEEIERGNVLSSPGWLAPTHALDVRVRMVAEQAGLAAGSGKAAGVPLVAAGPTRTLKHNAQVSFHTGALDALGRLALLDSDELKPGESGWAQIRLDRAVPVVKGDLFIIRLPAPNVTIGGGMVVDEHPKRHRRFQERVIGQLAVLEKGTPAERALQALESREPAELSEVAARLSCTWQEARDMLQPLLASGTVRVISPGANLAPSSWLLSSQGWERLLARVEEELRGYHQAHPLRRGIPKEELRTRLGLEPRGFGPVERALLASDSIAEDGPFLHLSIHKISLTADQEQRVQGLDAALRAAAASPPNRSELKSQFGVSEELLQVLIDRGQIIEVGTDLVYSRQTYEDMVDKVKGLIRDEGKVTVAQVRDAFQTSRKYALALLEHLDERRVTRRIGDERVLARS